jgi:hypothetical protein
MKNIMIQVMVRTDKNGPFSPIRVLIDPEKFLKSDNKDVYVHNIAKHHVVGGQLLEVEYRYTKEDAEKDSKQSP